MKYSILSIMILIPVALYTSCKEDDARMPETPSITKLEPAQGTVGKVVTLSGKNFSAVMAGNRVMFNGVPATVTSSTSTRIQTTVPEGATTGPVTVTVDDATTTSDVFTVLPPVTDDPAFYFGADLSYVNHILDKGGQYMDENAVRNPYRIFKDHGNDLVRLRIWHDPVWTKAVYEPDGMQLYNDVLDVERAIASSKEQGMKVLLDFHYSDIWADPGSQEIPAAWLDIKDISALRDSMYNYTYKTLHYLDSKGLMPEFVQIGNETNCGMLYEHNANPVPGFPSCNACNGQWSNLRTVINGAIQAVRDVSPGTTILLHVADPANVTFWFDNITAGTAVPDFDIIGFSYYPLWHTEVPLDALSDHIESFRNKYGKDIMILETAYPWTTAGNDSYNNILGGQPPVNGYPYTPQGQLDMLKKITQELLDGGGVGIIYWEPAWITSGMRDYWNTGSSWENCAFFDYNGNTTPAIRYMKHPYIR